MPRGRFITILKKVRQFFLPIMWMALIYWFSSQSYLPSPDDDLLNFILKKTAHMFMYGVLWWLWWRAFGSHKQVFTLAGVFTLVYAFLDEHHQSLVAARHPDIRDVLMDGFGLVIAVSLVKQQYISLIGLILVSLIYGTIYYSHIKATQVTSDQILPPPAATSPTPLPNTVTLRPQQTAIPPLLQQWLYPSSKITDNTAIQATGISSDSPDEIFVWYENRFTVEDLKTTTRVKTQANGTYAYTLNGSHEDLSVTVTLKKQAKATNTTITVHVEGPKATL